MRILKYTVKICVKKIEMADNFMVGCQPVKEIILNI